MENTGYFIVTVLEEIDIVTGLPTGRIKDNLPDDPDYIPPYIDYDACPIPTTTTTTIPIEIVSGDFDEDHDDDHDN